MRSLSILASLVFVTCAWAQSSGLTLPPSGDNQKAEVTQFIGPVKVSISYSSPKVHSPSGEDRRGKIWGQLVPYGLTDLGFGPRKPAPWRAGANENTVLEVSHPVQIDGKPLPAGRYGVHMLVGADEWTLILSKNSTSWGSFFYQESEDALRVPLKPRKHEYREYLTYEFTDRQPTKATAEMQWEDLAVSWTIQVPDIQKIYVSSLRNDLRSVPGFTWNGFVNAAQYCVQNNVELEQALQWADAAISSPFIGQANFTTLSTKAQVLAKLNRKADADAVMQQAINLPSALPTEIHQYARQLQAAGNNEEAIKVFKLNAQRNGDAWPVHVGLARAYSAAGDYPKALEHAKKAVVQAPDPLNKGSLTQMIKTLEQGQPIK